MGFLDKFKKKKTVEEEPPKEVVLYVLIEEIKMGVVDYFKNNGIEIKILTKDIDEARMALILSEENSRIVIVETGIGEFSLPEAKTDIADLLGVCEEDRKDFTIIYSTTSFKTDVLKMSNVKNGDCIRYENTVTILNKLKEYNEIYTTPGAKDLTVDDVLNAKGKKIDSEFNQVDNEFTEDFSKVTEKAQDDESIEAFEVTI